MRKVKSIKTNTSSSEHVSTSLPTAVEDPDEDTTLHRDIEKLISSAIHLRKRQCYKSISVKDDPPDPPAAVERLEKTASFMPDS